MRSAASRAGTTPAVRSARPLPQHGPIRRSTAPRCAEIPRPPSPQRRTDALAPPRSRYARRLPPPVGVTAGGTGQASLELEPIHEDSNGLREMVACFGRTVERSRLAWPGAGDAGARRATGRWVIGPVRGDA